MVQRTEVQGMGQLNAGQVSRSANVIRRQEPVVEGRVSSINRAASILEGLSGFVDVSSEAAFRQAQLDVEKKKIAGMSLAMSGGKIGEENTKAELMGYELVQSQSELAKLNEELATTIQQNPEMSDEEFNKVKETRYGELLAKYQDSDPDVFKAISVKAQESQITMYGIEQQSRQKYREFKAEETLNYNIGSQLDAAKTVEDGTVLIDQYISQGRAMGLSEPKIKDMLFNQMKLTASQGDNRLLTFISNVDWGKYTPESKQAQSLYKSYIKQAKAEYEAALQKQNVFAYGQGLAELERMAKSGASDAELTIKMQQLQGAGLKFSPSTVASYLTMGKQMSESQMQLQSNVAAWQQNKGMFNLAQNPYIPAEDKGKVLGAAEAAIVQQAEQVPEDQKADFTISNMIQLSKQEGMPVKTITTALTSLTQLDPQAPLTPSTQIWTKYLMAADDQTIRMNVPSEKDQAVLFGMRDYLINNQNQGEEAFKTAISRGQTVRDNKVPLSRQQTTMIQNKALSATKDFKDPTLQSWYFRAKGMPSEVRDYVTNQISARAQSLYGVTMNPEKAVEIATKEFRQNNMVLTGGVVANIGVNQLAAFVPEFAKQGDDATVVQKKAVSALDYQLDKVLQAQSKTDGMEYKREDARVIFSNSGQTYQVNVGGLNVGTFFTSDLKNEYNEEFFKKWNAEQESQQKTSEAYRTMKESKEFSSKLNPYMGLAR